MPQRGAEHIIDIGFPTVGTMDDDPAFLLAVGINNDRFPRFVACWLTKGFFKTYFTADAAGCLVKA